MVARFSGLIHQKRPKSSQISGMGVYRQFAVSAHHRPGGDASSNAVSGSPRRRQSGASTGFHGANA
jgi:hypothetical protein